MSLRYHPNNGGKVDCAFCGSKFYVPLCRLHLARFCSRKCADLVRRKSIEHKKNQRRRYYLANKEYIHARQNRWNKNNEEKRRAIKKKWAVANKEHINFLTKRRQFRLKGARGNYTKEEVDNLFVKHEGRCYYCKVNKATSIDHVIPISRGGSNYIHNLVPACIPCNSRKKDKLLSELNFKW